MGETHFGRVVAEDGFSVGSSGSGIGEVTWNPGSILDGDMEAKDIPLTGAALGDFVTVSASVDVLDLVLNGQVTAAGIVTAVLANNTGAAVDLGSMTARALVIFRA